MLLSVIISRKDNGRNVFARGRGECCVVIELKFLRDCDLVSFFFISSMITLLLTYYSWKGNNWEIIKAILGVLRNGS